MKMQILVQGRTKPFYFNFDSEPEFLQEWWDQELDVSVIVNEIPTWIPDWLDCLWYTVQDFFCREI